MTTPGMTAGMAAGMTARAWSGGLLGHRRRAPDAPAPSTLEVNALQAMCRQVFGFRLAMIALAAPSALLNASPGLGVRLVGTAVVVTFMISYALFRDWERFGPLLLRHPTLLAADTLTGSLLLISAGPDTTIAYVSVCTPLLAGIVYGWRGAACFASLQSLILLLVHATLHPGPDASLAERLLLPGFCVITGAVGSTLRGLMLRFGEATQALTTTRARLAATQATEAERARLAREMHDSVAKTLHGVALAAEALAHTARSANATPERLREQADLVARAARTAAAESRALLTDLRAAASDAGHPTDVLPQLAAQARSFQHRASLPTSYRTTGPRPTVLLSSATAHHLLAITGEALENAHRHAYATRVDVHTDVQPDTLHITIRDNGRGLPPALDTATLDALRRSGRFGLLGMTERAATLGATLDITGGGRGTEVRLELPLLRGEKAEKAEKAEKGAPTE
ncbi:sensor histidine kinase [Streptomyces sp. NPDC018693]|uniref:sensor histidine kinase n=1 Tax=unclassified Streptomyces TaxID=2593676 RepID=UPI0037A985A6